MMAAAQPFISGAISKTINLPNEASVSEIGECYKLSWELGLKANALYRDGSKLSQPLSTKSDASDHAEEADVEGLESAASAVTAEAGAPQIVERIVVREVERVVEKVIERPLRRRLQDTRNSRTHKFNVGGHEGYLIVGLYEDGRPGELFITMAKEGSTIGGLMDSLGTAISVALQYGVPVESLVTKFAHQRFEPMGMTSNKDIPFAKSLVDYIFRWLGMEFIAGYRDANAPKPLPQPVPASIEPARETITETRITEESTAWTSTRFTSGGDGTTSASIPHSQPPAAEGKTGASHSRIGLDAGSQMPSLFGESTVDPSALRVTTIIVEGGEMRAAGSSYSALDEANAQLMGDAPACDVCGTITVRNGTCYRCMNCGHSMGCS